MYFVGRRREIACIRKTLERGDNVIVYGRYGIGRTSLLKHIATLTHDHWRFVFVDFAQSGSVVCRTVFAQLFPKLKDKRSGAYLPYKLTRFEIAHLELDEARPLVLVLDNIAALSAHKVSLVRYLARAKRFRLGSF
jgi:AAA+ ATPase superfamily predicted ATPase